MNNRLLYKVKEVAEMLGIGRSKAYELVRIGEIPSVRVGASLRVRGQDVQDYVDNLYADSKSDYEPAS